MSFYSKYLVVRQKEVPLQCVFHSIRFKVNKRLVVVKQPFFCLSSKMFIFFFHFICSIILLTVSTIPQ